MKLEVIEVKPQGYCGGVMSAIRKVKDYRKEHPEGKVTLLGSLVHNSYVNQALALLDIDVLEAHGKTRLELLDLVDEGTIIFTAHGISEQVRQKALEKGLNIIDASCRFVKTTQEIVKNQLEKGSTVLYIGKNHHPEAESIYSGQEKVILIEKESDIPSNLTGDIFVTNQTTMSIHEISHLFKAIQDQYPHAQFSDELCNATRVRQQAVLDLKDQGFDCLVVVGDKKSNNTKKLEATGKLAGIHTVLFAETAQDLDPKEYAHCQKIAVTSGASTPGWIKDQVIRKLKDPSLQECVRLEEIL